MHDRRFPLKQTKQKLFKYDLIGFDIETFGNKNEFYCASFYNGYDFKTFFTKEDVLKHFLSYKEPAYFVATNLQFDFFGIFYGTGVKHNPCFRQSQMISTNFYVQDNKFFMKRPSTHAAKLTFIDTGNYMMASVDTLGRIIGLPKLEKPSFLGRKPENDAELKELITYNRRDAEISQKFIKFLYSGFESLGATPKITIASTAMSLYKNKYLDTLYFRHETPDLMNIFQGYYGGRCEVFQRGELPKCKYYDFNSLYPSVMTNEYPNPNTLRKNHVNSTYYIDNFEGMANVVIKAPDLDIPLLPFYYGDKLLFPNGKLSGFYTNIELRKAAELGYQILEVKDNFYYKDTVTPFKRYVEDLYELRLKYQKEKNPVEKTIKLLLNSLYGKFGQKFNDRDEWVMMPETLKELNELDFTERFGDYLRIKHDFTQPKAFCMPIWAAYTTAMGRLKLYDYLWKVNPFYCDTDSLITTKDIEPSNKLGKLKLEFNVDYGIALRPKFYALRADNMDIVRMKGISRHITYTQFQEMITSKKVSYKKFMKVKEALRRGFTINEIVEINKELNIEDDKREWNGPFNGLLQSSRPKVIDIDLIEKELKLKEIEKQIKAKNMMSSLTKEIAQSDIFDAYSVGYDISNEEFIENELFFAKND